MKPRIRILLACGLSLVAGAAMAQGFPPPPRGHAGTTVRVVAEGLHDPRGLVLAPWGQLYIAEAGTGEGVFVPPPPPPLPPVEERLKTRCEVYWPVGPKTPNHSGRISRLDPQSGRLKVVAADLPASTTNTLIGGDRLGVGAVAFLGNRLHAVLSGAGCAQGHPSEPNAVLRIYTDGTALPIADLSNYLRTTPDSKSPADADYEPDGVWFNLVAAYGALYAVEPNRGVFVRIDRRGSITPVVDLIDAVTRLEGDGDQTFAALAVHRGDFYVGTLGRIDTDFSAAVYRVARDGSEVERVASGLHGVLGIAFDRQGRLYVLETTAAGVDPPLSDPSVGRIVRVGPDGGLEELVTGLAFPTALVAGNHGEFYVTNCGYHCDDRRAFPASLPSLRVGQVLRVEVPGAMAEPGGSDAP